MAQEQVEELQRKVNQLTEENTQLREALTKAQRKLKYDDEQIEDRDDLLVRLQTEIDEELEEVQAYKKLIEKKNKEIVELKRKVLLIETNAMQREHNNNIGDSSREFSLLNCFGFCRSKNEQPNGAGENAEEYTEDNFASRNRGVV